MADPTLRERNGHNAVHAVSREFRGAPLPAPLTSFVGREREVATITAFLCRDDVRLVTLTGPGGVGKTRLALHTGEGLTDWFLDGAVLVDLTPLVDPRLVAPTLAQALGLREAGTEPLIERLKVALRDRQLLLLLDNFERVLDAAPFVGELLVAAPRTKVLATSREPLRLAAEHVMAVTPLADADAVQLFVDRAEAARAGFILTAENAASVAEICRRLDGLPLAIELAAARIAHLPPAALLARLDTRLPLLTGGARDLPQRQRTMRDAIAWSHDLLDDEERVLFRRLAVFVGGGTLEAIAAVTAAPGSEPGVLDGIASLVAKSLVQPEQGSEGEPRYRMLETVREFGLERLESAGERALMRQRHADFFLSFAETRILPYLAPGTPHLEHVIDDEDNLRAALVWADEQEDAQTLLRLTAAMAPFWQYRVHFVEGLARLEQALARVPVTAHDGRRQVVAWLAAKFARHLGAHDRALALVAEMTAGAHAAGHDAWRAQAWLAQCHLDQNEGAFDRALEAAQEAMAILQGLDDPTWLSYAEYQAGYISLLLFDLDCARTLLESALCRSESLNLPVIEGLSIAGLGVLARLRGDYKLAAELFRTRLAMSWDGWALLISLEDLAVTAAECGEAARSAHLFGAAEAFREVRGIPLAFGDSSGYQPSIAKARAALGEKAFSAARATGRRFSEDEARAEAALVATDWRFAPLPIDRAALDVPLTPRELEVARLVAAGRSNREIADALCISVPTVKRHMTTILGKLALPSRSALNTYAHEHQLV